MSNYLCEKCQHVLQVRLSEPDFVIVTPCSECAAAHAAELKECEEQAAEDVASAQDDQEKAEEALVDFIDELKSVIDRYE